VTAIGFLTGQKLVEIRYSLGLVRFVFDEGDRVEPALYADLGPFAITGADGVAELVDPDDPSTLRPAFCSSERKLSTRRSRMTARLPLVSPATRASGANPAKISRRGRS
jgi:hypothetical protein